MPPLRAGPHPHIGRNGRSAAIAAGVGCGVCNGRVESPRVYIDDVRIPDEPRLDILEAEAPASGKAEGQQDEAWHAFNESAKASNNPEAAVRHARGGLRQNRDGRIWMSQPLYIRAANRRGFNQAYGVLAINLLLLPGFHQHFRVVAGHRLRGVHAYKVSSVEWWPGFRPAESPSVFQAPRRADRP